MWQQLLETGFNQEKTAKYIKQDCWFYTGIVEDWFYIRENWQVRWFYMGENWQVRWFYMGEN